MADRSIAASLVTGLIASQRLDNVPNAEPFRNNFLVSGLLCGSPAAQVLFNMRTADDLADVLKDRAQLQARLATHRFAILSAPSIAGALEVGETLKAVPGQYEGVAEPDAIFRKWFVADRLAGQGDEYLLKPEDADRQVSLCEELKTAAGTVAVITTATVTAQPRPVE
jgi:hypothetical protein